jgi:hypothetical protein
MVAETAWRGEGGGKGKKRLQTKTNNTLARLMNISHVVFLLKFFLGKPSDPATGVV